MQAPQQIRVLKKNWQQAYRRYARICCKPTAAERELFCPTTMLRYPHIANTLLILPFTSIVGSWLEYTGYLNCINEHCSSTARDSVRSTLLMYKVKYVGLCAYQISYCACKLWIYAVINCGASAAFEFFTENPSSTNTSDQTHSQPNMEQDTAQSYPLHFVY